ncbi:hypothetical protein ABMA27_000942 [Loxostege sticticalis]|uniref:Uncharacterized protein n=1 Tax=Loxostege sticticalis TaxID=481309 RepID=A0ABR3I0Y9_LOXSC
MSADSGGTSAKMTKKKRKADEPILPDLSDEEEENKYAPYFKKNHIRSYPVNSPSQPGTVFPVYIESVNDSVKFGNKDPIYLNNIFSRYTKGVKEIKRVNALRYAIIFDSPKNANSLLTNTEFLSLHEVKAFIPASTSESTGVIKFIPTDLSCKHLFDKLISTQEILSVRRFTKKTPDGIVPLQTVTVTFSGNILPAHVSYGLCTLPVEQYIKPVIQCFKCMGFGHTTKFCKRNVVCSVCSQSHHFKDCTNKDKPLCANCKGEHIAVSKLSFFPALNKSYAKAMNSPLPKQTKKNDDKDILSDVINNDKILKAIVDTLLKFSNKDNNLPINTSTIKEIFIKNFTCNNG